MSDFDPEHQARVDSTNTAWSLGTFGAVIGNMAFGEDRGILGNFTLGTGIVAVGTGGQVGHRVYQETGDAGLSITVGKARGLATFVAGWVFLGAAICAILGCLLPLWVFAGEAWTPWCVALLWPAWLGWKHCKRVWAENARLCATGMPDPQHLREHGYVHVGGQYDLWVKPHPGYTVADTLRSAGIDPTVIDVES